MSQIFKLKIPNTELFELLDTICVKTSNHYFFNTISFKKGLLDDKIQYYLNKWKPFYHMSKQKYLEKKLTYNSFTTILRQICKNNKVSFTSKIKYDKSSYEIQYFIYFQ
jgi:hypothetical protein